MNGLLMVIYRMLQNPMAKLQEVVGERIWSVKCK
jgi:hypothetical protein